MVGPSNFFKFGRLKLQSVCIEFLCSFQNVLQMASSALKAHLHTSRKIVNDSHTFLLWDFPDLCCDCCLQFTNCLRIVLIHIILEIPPQIKIWGVQVWWMRYVAVLMKFWASLGRRKGIDRDEQWFRQDGGHPPHNKWLPSLAWRAI